MVTIANESAIDERGSHGGPQSGGYLVWAATVGEQAASVTPEYHWKVPFPCKIVHVTAKADTIGSTPEYTVATTTGDVIASRALPTTLEEFSPGGSNDLNAVAAVNRVLAEGETLSALFTTVGGETIVGGCVTVTLRNMGHPTGWLADDD